MARSYEQDDLIDPEIGFKSDKINSEFFVGRLLYQASLLGINMRERPEEYKNCIQQIEIWAMGSDKLQRKSFGAKNAKNKKTYFQMKQELREKIDKRLREISKEFNPKISRGNKNKAIQSQINNIELDYSVQLHYLLTEALGTIMWTKYIYERI